MTSYLTVVGETEVEVEVLKSRFRCTLARIETEDAARDLLDRVRGSHWNARHHCHGYLLGPEAHLRHTSDDGEPAGTAGMPILEQLRGHGLSDVVAVVSRWFGGTLLGAGRLARAYAAATRAAVEQAEVIERELYRECQAAVEVGDVGRLEHLLRTHQSRAVTVDYQPSGHPPGVAVIDWCTPPDDVDQLQHVLAEHTGGRLVVQLTGQRWVDLDQPHPPLTPARPEPW